MSPSSFHFRALFSSSFALSLFCVSGKQGFTRNQPQKTYNGETADPIVALVPVRLVLFDPGASTVSLVSDALPVDDLLPPSGSNSSDVVNATRVATIVTSGTLDTVSTVSYVNTSVETCPKRAGADGEASGTRNASSSEVRTSRPAARLLVVTRAPYART